MYKGVYVYVINVVNPIHNKVNPQMESAKWRAYVLACFTCSRAWRASKKLTCLA